MMSAINLVALCVVCVFIICVSLPLSGAQVTFSRDWNAGKRSFGDTNPSECSALWRTIATLCTAISKNLHHLSMCEARTYLHNDDFTDTTGGSVNQLFNGLGQNRL